MRTSIGVLVIAVLVALAAALGVLAGSVLTGVLVFVGFLLVWMGCSAISARSYGAGWLAIAVGVALTAVAMWRGAMGGRWLWLAPWMLQGVIVAVVGADARSHSRRNGESLIAFGLLLMVFAVLAPLSVYPALSENAAKTGGTGVAFSVADGLRTVGGVLREAFTSFWGWVSLGFVIVVGAASWRRFGAWLVPAMVLAATFVVGAVSAEAGDAVAVAAGASPATWLRDLVLASDEHWGTAGWGILLLSVGLVAASLSLLRKLFVMNQVTGAAQREVGNDNDAVVRYATEEGYGPGTSMLVIFAFQLLYVGTVAMLWVGLRRAAGVAGPLPFDAVGIPDLAVPDFRPVWGLPYFVLALVLGVSAVVSGRIYVRRSVTQRVPVLTSPVWQVGVVLIGAFVAPAGLILLGVGSTWLQAAVVVPLSRRKRLRHDERQPTGTGGPFPVGRATADYGTAAESVAAAAGTGPAGDAGAAGRAVAPSEAGAAGAVGRGFDDRPVWERDGREEVPIWGAADVADSADPAEPSGPPSEPTPSEPTLAEPTLAEPAAADRAPPTEPAPAEPVSVVSATPADSLVGRIVGGASGAVAVVSLFKAGPLTDLVRTADDEYVVLKEDGRLALYKGGEPCREKRLHVVRPLGLGAVAGRHVAFVEGAGRILEVSLDDGDYPDDTWGGAAHVVHSGVIEDSDCFAVSPQGTLVVWATAARPQVSGLFLSSEVKRTILDGVERPTALGFSSDGGRVAVGTAAGDVLVADLGGQGSTLTLSGAPVGGRPVVAVAGASGDHWLVAYENERIALWAADDCATHVDTGGAVACVAVDDNGRVAVGTRLGLVRVYGEGLGQVVADARPFTAAVRRLLFVRGGAAVVCAAATGEVRRLELA